MIQIACPCGHRQEAPESQAGRAVACESCGRVTYLVASESLAAGAGAGDFDAQLVIEAGPAQVGESFRLGGALEIDVGKHPERQIRLAGNQVSRAHCKLARVDFGPSRWRVEDTRSTNGTFVNGRRIESQELRPGDRLTIGEFTLRYCVDGDSAGEGAWSTDEAAAGDLDALGALEALEHVPVEEPADANVAAPQAIEPAAQTVSRVRPLAYATPQAQERFLGESNVDWVMKLRNAASLMVAVIVVDFAGCLVSAVAALQTLVACATGIMGMIAAWLLTAPEPNTSEPPVWSIVRIALRGCAIGAGVGAIVVGLSELMEAPELKGTGSLMVLLLVPQTFLFLLYLWRLAKRIPNPALATNALILAIALPSAIALVVGGAIYASMTQSVGALVLTGIGGLVTLLVLRIWYIIVLIWFSRSFS